MTTGGRTCAGSELDRSVAAANDAGQMDQGTDRAREQEANLSSVTYELWCDSTERRDGMGDAFF
jgi:hypothetical protein